MEHAPDSSGDWVIPEASRPPTVAELVRRIDEAEARARSSESVAIAVGDAALDAADRARASVDQAMLAAEQAHRSALLVEQLGAELLERRGRPGEAGPPQADRGPGSFDERADRVVTRLQAIGRVPLGAERAGNPTGPATVA